MSANKFLLLFAVVRWEGPGRSCWSNWTTRGTRTPRSGGADRVTRTPRWSRFRVLCGTAQPDSWTTWLSGGYCVTLGRIQLALRAGEWTRAWTRPRPTRLMSAEIQHHALPVLQPERKLQPGLAEWLHLLVVDDRAHSHDACSGCRCEALH